MNIVKVVSHLSNMPEGMGVELRRQRATVLLGLGMSLAIPLPGSPVEPTMLRNYFQEQTTAMRDNLFKINEALPMDVDRSCEYAFRLYERRYQLAFSPKVSDLLSGTPFSGLMSELVQEFSNLAITNGEVQDAIVILRDDQAE